MFSTHAASFEQWFFLEQSWRKTITFVQQSWHGFNQILCLVERNTTFTKKEVDISHEHCVHKVMQHHKGIQQFWMFTVCFGTYLTFCLKIIFGFWQKGHSWRNIGPFLQLDNRFCIYQGLYNLEKEKYNHTHTLIYIYIYMYTCIFLYLYACFGRHPTPFFCVGFQKHHEVPGSLEFNEIVSLISSTIFKLNFSWNQNPIRAILLLFISFHICLYLSISFHIVSYLFISFLFHIFSCLFISFHIFSYFFHIFSALFISFYSISFHIFSFVFISLHIFS